MIWVIEKSIWASYANHRVAVYTVTGFSHIYSVSHWLCLRYDKLTCAGNRNGSVYSKRSTTKYTKSSPNMTHLFGSQTACLEFCNTPNIYTFELISVWREILVCKKQKKPWWRHEMEIFSALLDFYEVNPAVTAGFPSQRPVTGSCDVSLMCTRTDGWVNGPDADDLRRHKTHCDVTVMKDQNHRTMLYGMFHDALVTPGPLSTKNMPSYDYMIPLYIADGLTTVSGL